MHKCVAAIPPLPPVVSLPWQLEALLPNEKRRRVDSMSVAQNTVAQLLEESREEREKKRYVCVRKRERERSVWVLYLCIA